MKAFDYLRRAYYKLSYYYQKFQFIVMSIVVAGIVDYFFIYEILVSLSALVPVFILEIAPVIIIILSIIIIRGIVKFIKKMKENKHLLFLF
ncbi:hypothetical protein P4H66_08835 [Paenibacillus dokdonensis]|uniref:Uncharacterized protein n=1 Tax=Paenibacillus dokdonensis TaxID=2567944 RepID=A0ABU6GML4_9BACL|nr:hypothetical protein [Paenibacillus dokdonensis]MEC0239950.1 hypothetical protein [Paenibacillus dokdonensis]